MLWSVFSFYFVVAIHLVANLQQSGIRSDNILSLSPAVIMQVILLNVFVYISLYTSLHQSIARTLYGLELHSIGDK